MRRLVARDARIRQLHSRSLQECDRLVVTAAVRIEIGLRRQAGRSDGCESGRIRHHPRPTSMAAGATHFGDATLVRRTVANRACRSSVRRARRTHRRESAGAVGGLHSRIQPCDRRLRLLSFSARPERSETSRACRASTITMLIECLMPSAWLMAHISKRILAYITVH